jgi:DnaK suppressor protein
MNEQQLNHLKTLLVKELDAQGNRPLVNEKLIQEELEGVDNHMADSATELEMMTTEHALNEHSKDEVKKIEAALNAIEKGTYGKCEVCQKQIPYQRLEVMPTVLRCVDHVDHQLSM